MRHSVQIFLHFFKRCSHSRVVWLLIATTALALELAALYFQHIMLLPPCVLCIYERCALFGILSATLVGAFTPKSSIRYVWILVWMYSAWKGVEVAWRHTMLQLHPSPFSTCDFLVIFPSWLPLSKWLPTVFRASSDCAVHQCLFLRLTISQWLVGIFISYLLLSIIVFIAQFTCTRHRDFFNH